MLLPPLAALPLVSAKSRECFCTDATRFFRRVEKPSDTNLFVAITEMWVLDAEFTSVLDRCFVVLDASKPERDFSPSQDTIAVQKLEHGAFLRRRLRTADRSRRDDHIAALVERDRER